MNSPKTPQTQTAGQRDYEADLAKRPNYHDGQPRKAWDQLGEVEQWSWNRQQTGKGNAPRVPKGKFYLGLTGDHRDAKAERYVARIRNPAKKQYARDTLNYIRFGDCSYLDGNYKLSAMAKQAVNLTFSEIYPKA